MTVFFEDSFNSAHWLPNVAADSPLGRMHGHTYHVRIEVTGPVGEKTGWVLDYETIRKSWTPVKAGLDHRCLNDVLLNPTCERLAEWIAAGMGPWCTRVELRETVNCGVVWERGRE